MNLESRRSRYLRDPLPLQLGGLASNVSRIGWLARQPDELGADAVFRESKHFTEWAAASGSQPQQLALLSEAQWRLSAWQRSWQDRAQRLRLADEADTLAQRLLKEAGLI